MATEVKAEKPNTWLWIVALLIVLGLVGLAVWYLTKEKKE